MPMNGRPIEAIAYHGWGFGSEFWAGWVARFGLLGSLRCADRGYFGATQSVEFEQVESFKILLTHSYGLHWCPVEQLRSADLLICLAGFGSFHPDDGAERRRSERRVARMINVLGTEPESVLTEFWRNCLGRDAEETSVKTPDLTQANWALLDRDLRDLDRCQLDPQAFLPRRSIIIHGSADRIVPLSQGLALAQSIAQPAPTWIELENASHCFPLCETDQAWSLIQPLLP
jgi:pimeloyl-[acyl-carrier protein] methyl ester esterase